MKKRHIAAVTGVLAALLAACGGSGTDSGTSKSAQTLASVTTSGVANAPTRWASLKFGGGGYVPGLVYHPTSPDVLYARTDIGGAYRWDAATKAWVAITDGFGSTEGFYHGTETMALDPNDDQRVYMSAGMYLSDKPDARLYISTDRGANWQHVDLPFSAGSNNQGRAVGERLMVDPNKPSILFYATRANGMWKSSDYGQTWSQVASLATHNMTKDEINAVTWSGVVGFEQVIFDTNTKGTGSATQTIYTAVGRDYAAVAGLNHSMYKTTDGGATWQGIATPADVAGFFVPHMVRNKDGMMYVAFTKETGPGAGGPSRLYKFDGANWTLLKKYDTEQWVNFGMGGLSVSGTGASTRIALGVTNSWGNYDGQPVVQLSDDAGATWREIAATAPHLPASSGFSGWTDDVEIDPNNPEHILHVHGGGVWETHNASAAKPTWTDASGGIEEVATSALMAPPPGASYTLLRSAGDVGTSVQTELLKSPTRGSWGMFNSTYSSDMAWSNPAYMVTTGSHVWNSTAAGAYSLDSGVTWKAFAANHPDALANESGAGNLAVTKLNNVVWAPSHSAPAYTTDNGATWTYTNLPALNHVGIDRAYHLVADRKNPNKVYAYNSGGAWWSQWSETAHFYTSTDGGHTFTESATFAANSWTADFYATSIAVNPNAEGDIWVVDGKSILHSLDSGATWTKLSAAAPIWGQSAYQPDVYGATSVALGKAPSGAKYSASVYVVGVINGVWGVYRSDDGGAIWARFNDDKHQFGGMGQLAADQNVPGRLYAAGGGRGVLFSY
ncbi:dockerin [Duganella sp. BJB488]|uniref:dockerin n=1 Tax=unclassified Duganella TaxID=2636909 RepID=UPI000E356882|nr:MULTISPECIES: dockerin [unclassified Duganella]RFP17838.1 dockerin [Duganella sp. BJB489]RFP22345.1 dockerin [Duganella sp. BJB488]RFP37678.1 dockerin [Duganella sp. BJB480]